MQPDRGEAVNYIAHVTLNTGNRVRQYRDRVDNKVIAIVRAAIDDALATPGHPVPVPGGNGATMTATRAGTALLVSLFASDGTPVLTTGIALKPQDGAKLWQILKRDRPDLVHPTLQGVSQPPAPWIADRHYGLLDQTWTGDFTRCLGWAWHYSGQ